jgi:NAD(P)-dependent dehydrogenase (short-subunit alcohol dehydrogenase family)
VLSIATTYAETGSAYVVPSAVSKAGVVAMTRSLAALASILLSDLTAYVSGEVVTFDGGEALSAGGQFNTFARMPREQVKAMMEKVRPD